MTDTGNANVYTERTQARGVDNVKRSPWYIRTAYGLIREWIGITRETGIRPRGYYELVRAYIVTAAENGW